MVPILNVVATSDSDNYSVELGVVSAIPLRLIGGVVVYLHLLHSIGYFYLTLDVSSLPLHPSSE